MEQLQSHICITNGLLILWGNICAFPHILGSPTLLCNCSTSTLNFLNYEENSILFFISVVYIILQILKGGGGEGTCYCMCDSGWLGYSVQCAMCMPIV
jgi:hypothetical protein